MRKYWVWFGVLLPCVAWAQQQGPDRLPDTKVPVVGVDSVRSVAKEVLRPDELATLNPDSLPVSIILSPFQPVPRKATIYSLIFPGAGQFYNHDYWKMPLVYAGIGGAAYMIHWNTIRYQDFLKPYLSSVDGQGNPVDKTEFNVYIRGKDEYRMLTLDQIKRGKTYYRRYREYGFVIFALVYALTAVEANVAAHLKSFNANMNEDLTIRLEPSSESTFLSQKVSGVKVVLRF